MNRTVASSAAHFLQFVLQTKNCSAKTTKSYASNQPDLEARNIYYNKTIKEVKEKFEKHLPDKILSRPHVIRAFWPLTKHVNISSNDCSLAYLSADCSIITSSKEKRNC